MVILLLGLCHCHQLVGHPKASKKFPPYLKDLCLREKPDVIAEELSEDAIEKFNAIDSVARRLAKSSHVRHLFIDPDIEERRILGIKCRPEIIQELGYGPCLTREQSAEADRIERIHWEKRERFWLERLKDCEPRKCVLLVGADHVDRFAALLNVNGFQPKVVQRDWTP